MRWADANRAPAPGDCVIAVERAASRGVERARGPEVLGCRDESDWNRVVRQIEHKDTEFGRQHDAKVSWEVLRLDRGLGSYSRPWDHLNDSLFGAHPLLGSTFVEPLLKFFGTGSEHLALRRRGADIDAMCILVPERRMVWRSFLPSQAQIGLTLVRTSAQLEGLVRALPGPVVQLDLLCCDPRFSAVWAACSRQPVICMPHAVTISIDLSSTFERWWSLLPKQLKKNVGRYEKRAASLGPELRLRRWDHEADVQAAVQRYAALEDMGWKGANGTSLGATEEQLGFYVDLLTTAARSGLAHVYELWLGEKLAASRLLFRSGRSVVILKTTYDESMKEWAPGRLLLKRVVEDAFRSWPGDKLEFYTNATSEQLAWADEQRSIVHVSIHRNRLIHLAASAKHAMRNKETGDRLEEAVESIAVDKDVDDETQRLFGQMETQHFQLGLDWWRLFGRTVMAGSAGARMLMLRRDGRAVAALPVNVDPALTRFGGMVGGLVNYYSTNYLPVASEDVTGLDLQPLVARLRQEVAGQPMLKFEPMDPLSPLTSALESALDLSGYAVERYSCSGNWYLPVQQSWEDYLQGRPGELRNTIKRMSRRLASKGGYTEIVTAPDDHQRAFEAFDAVYRNSWKPNEPVPGFMKSLVEMCAARGWLRMGIAWLEGRPIAAQLWIVHSSRALIYKLAYDKDYKSYSPGTVLTAALMRHVIEIDRVAEVDYLAGDEPYKAHWMTQRRDRCGLVANDLRSIGGWAGAIKQLGSKWNRSLPSG